MAKSLLGRWVQSSGRIVTISTTSGFRVQGRWTGEKGGIAGCFGRLENGGKVIKGVWFDDDAGVKERDNAAITITLSEDGSSFTAAVAGKGGGMTEWTAHRPSFKRDGGKIAEFGFRKREVFDRLTEEVSEKHKAWAETQRTAVLSGSIRDTQALRGSDGAITFIPSLAVGDIYDDSALRRHTQHSRHMGKQLLGGVNIAGRPGATAKAPPFEWEASPFQDISTVNALLRKAKRERITKSVPPALLARKPFRPTNDTVAVHKTGDEVFVSTLVDASLPDDVMKKMASDAHKLSAEAASVSGNLVRGPDGKLTVLTGAKNMVAGHAHWVDAAAAHGVYLEPLPETAAPVKTSTSATAAAAGSGGETGKRGSAAAASRPPFSPVGPAIVRAPVAADTAPIPMRPITPAADTSAEGHDKPMGKDKTAKTERPPYNPHSHYEPAGASKFPEFMPDPLPGGAVERLKAAGKLGRAAAATAASAPQARPHFTAMSPHRIERYATSVQLHPLNMAKLAST